MRARLISSLFLRFWLVLLTALVLTGPAQARGSMDGLDVVQIDQLPREAQQTMALIRQGGPFPYPKDGAVFGNYEGVLPKQKRGYYHEFTVPTPRARNRGARRIVSGGDPRSSGEYYYTSDHYKTFRRVHD
ncbi:ribonuclease domain-containing protein [Herbaspirillum sp. YR522]|uniref:ribonuclease domain-containing protein n=1 Tax=Herbaspirillum sp. YR522 TaxID=1144342 RepID=UPI00026F7632|nr:ribonuclease [Herbaspirillum sp. YR522]EJN10023.1 guanyl-specific ribonuclease Sa [Herbaspirillum sp. YR522]